MKLYIAEKPSLGRAIAGALPGPLRKERGLLRCGSGESAITVSWCIGHLLEPAEPAHYNPQWKNWTLQDLPLVPAQWAISPRENARDQLNILQRLIGEASLIIHAGDPDREGQLLVDEVLRYAGARCPVQRVLINDLNPEAVARALAAPEDNRHFRRLSHSALARQRADWLYGINLTRFYTLNHRRPGERGVYSVGRVQTPVLGLVVERDNTIARFEPRPFYRLQITCEPGEEAPETRVFQARWRPDENYRHVLDEEDRLLDQSVAETIAVAVSGRPGAVTGARFRDRHEKPPLPLSLSALQIEAGRLFRMAASDVLQAAQSLYEKHQLITYPRSDCRYLPEGHLADAEAVITAIAGVAEPLAPLASGANLTLRSAAWDNGRVDAHHAIIPTKRHVNASALTQQEARVYGLVARYYLMQFYPAAVHREGRLDIAINEHRFRATETAVTEPGWKALEIRQRDTRERSPVQALPKLQEGDRVMCTDTDIQTRKTQPPGHFTDATLLSAMTNIARFVSDPGLRKTLRETDGLGTEATRANILETLFSRDYLYRDNRYIKASEKGHSLISALPQAIRVPDTTALWEATLEQIRQGAGDPRAFMGELEKQVRELVSQPEAGTGPTATATTNAAPGQVHCPRCRAAMRERDGKYGRFWACSRYPQCNGTRPLEDSAAGSARDRYPNSDEDGSNQKPVPCPHCYSPLVRRKGRKGWFWGCSNYPGCRQTVDDDQGKPRLPEPPSR